MVIRNQIRPSCARVKVEVDLLQKFPKRIKVGVRKLNGEVDKKWVRIKYDYIPKYCTTCKIQGHTEEECYFLHPELYPERKPDKEKDNNKGEDKGKKVENGENKEIGPQEQKFEEPKNRHTGKSRGKGTIQMKTI